MTIRAFLLLSLVFSAAAQDAAKSGKAIKVFILAGDEHVLENALVEPRKPDKAQGTLTSVVASSQKYGFLKGTDGKWAYRDDVMLYDAHSIHNNTEAPAKPVQVGVKGHSGPDAATAIGVDLMLSHRLGAALDEPVLIIRYATKHPTWFMRGSRDLSHDFRPPSSGGGSDLEGSWDVIHFNHGVWDASYREATSKYFSGHNTTSVADFEKNLRTLVAKMKTTKAS